MAMAVQKVFPSAQCTIGPWIDRGFYYDFYYPEGFTDKDMKKIQKEMYKIIRKDYPLRREEVSREEAERRIREINEPYKARNLRSHQDGADYDLSHRRRVVGFVRGTSRGVHGQA